MAKQKIQGPYRVNPTDTGYELVELVGKELTPLRPRRIYEKDQRQAAYMAMARMNRRQAKEASPS